MLSTFIAQKRLGWNWPWLWGSFHSFIIFLNRFEGFWGVFFCLFKFLKLWLNPRRSRNQQTMSDMNFVPGLSASGRGLKSLREFIDIVKREESHQQKIRWKIQLCQSFALFRNETKLIFNVKAYRGRIFRDSVRFQLASCPGLTLQARHLINQPAINSQSLSYDRILICHSLNLRCLDWGKVNYSQTGRAQRVTSDNVLD